MNEKRSHKSASQVRREGDNKLLVMVILTLIVVGGGLIFAAVWRLGIGGLSTRTLLRRVLDFRALSRFGRIAKMARHYGRKSVARSRRVDCKTAGRERVSMNG
ncbi:MAG: hypothetical protein HC804_01535 [Anaerolineae bacterium]|nr:hypothetical protein [Anaerolineae bacterium]